MQDTVTNLSEELRQDFSNYSTHHLELKAMEAIQLLGPTHLQKLHDIEYPSTSIALIIVHCM